MKFLIQTINNQIKHDFSFTLLESIDYNNWSRRNDDFSYETIEWEDLDSENYSDMIPIGSVEFVSDYLKRYFGKVPKPINIPEVLLDEKYTGRKVINGTEKDINGFSFVKSNDKIKSFTDICDSAPPGNYQISEYLEEGFDTEWRGFVFNNELVGLNHYTGDFKLFPDINTIENMISVYDGPVAYTIDVGIMNGNTYIVEVHDFFSCGLYGFSDHRKILFMFIRWFQNFTK